MDRKSQILAKPKIAGGFRKPAKTAAKVPPTSNLALKKLVDSMPDNVAQVAPTAINYASFKQGEDIINFTNLSVKSLHKKGKNIALLISGDHTVVNQKEMISNLPDNLDELLENIKKVQ